MKALQAHKSLLFYYLLQLFTTFYNTFQHLTALRLVVCNALQALQRVTLSTPLALKTPLNKTAGACLFQYCPI